MFNTNQKNLIGWNMENSYAKLPQVYYNRQHPNAVNAPEMVVLNAPLAGMLGLDAKALGTGEGVSVLSGNAVPPGSEPLAQAYAGHQFGHFTMLGDGRALLLGEQITPRGERFDIQLKGSGKTPYSRRGDGRAALGPMLREYIISEAMHALGIPTTRSLCVVKTGEPVFRDTVQPGAVLARVASSHIRVGTFEYAARWASYEELKALADYTLSRHFPEANEDGNRYIALLREVIRRQALLIANWQMVGFIHGVMNTDNMAVSGETIDYGPCAFMDVYNAKTVFSSIDIHGRYAYGNQPVIAEWDLARFAETLLPLLHDGQEQAVGLAQEELSKFGNLFHSHWLSGMRAKLGLFNEEPEDETLIEQLLNIMQEHKADYTNTFRSLTLGTQEQDEYFSTEEFQHWKNMWTERLDRQPESKTQSQQLMRDSNPALIPRNHRVEEALDAAVQQNDYSVMERLLGVLSNPYAYTCDHEAYAQPSGPSVRPYRTFCGT